MRVCRWDFWDDTLCEDIHESFVSLLQSASSFATQGIERYEYQKSELPITARPHYNCRDLHSKTFPCDLRPCHPPLPHTLIVTQKPAAAQGTDLLFPRSTYTGLNPARRLSVPAVWQPTHSLHPAFASQGSSPPSSAERQKKLAVVLHLTCLGAG